MEWVTRFFLFKSKQWRLWVANLECPSAGKLAYMEKQIAMWKNMAEQAYRAFVHARLTWGLSLDSIQLEYKQ